MGCPTIAAYCSPNTAISSGKTPSPFTSLSKVWNANTLADTSGKYFVKASRRAASADSTSKAALRNVRLWLTANSKH